MKVLFLASILLSITQICAEEAPQKPATRVDPFFDSASQFTFFSVLEGLYTDGVSTKDVSQILMKQEGETYFHFVYACPVCTPTIWALEAYQSRPQHFYSLKSGASSFGPGLSPELQVKLYSDNASERLSVINELVNNWIQKRMKMMSLSDADRRLLVEALEKKRKEGASLLSAFKSQKGEGSSAPSMAPAYGNVEECAACNGAVGKPLKLAE